jgi:hypothetical protein
MITKPVWRENVGIYNFDWDDLNLYAKMDRIFSKEKTLIGELKLWHKQSGNDEIIELSRLDLLSDRARNNLAMSLDKRNKSIDWLSVLKYICFITVDHYRKGEPIEFLGDEPKTMEQEFLLYPILRKNQPTTVFSDGGTGKSLLADYSAVLVFYGYPGFFIPWMGLPLTPDGGNVLFLDWEADKEDHQKRVWAIKKGLGIIDADRFFYRKCNQPIVDDIAEIQKIVKDNKIIFVIIDSQVAASGDTKDPADGARRYYNALRSLNCTTLTIDHVPKGNGLNDTHKPYGSTFKWNLSRSQFELKKVQQPGENVMQLALYHRKNNEGLLLNPIGYQVEFVNSDNSILDKVVFTGIDVSNELASGEVANLSYRINKLLSSTKTGQMSLDNIATFLKLDKSVVLTCLEQHRESFEQKNNLWHTVTIDYGE